MSEWNLSVRLTGQGSDLAATLRDSAKEAGKLKDRVNDAKQALTELRAAAANDITIRLDLDAGHLRSDVNAALSTAGSGQGLQVRLDVDGDHLRADVTAALAAASGQNLTISLDVDADHLRAEVQAAIAAAGGQSLTVDINVNDAGLTALRASTQDTAHGLNVLQRAAREAKNELEELEGRSLTTAAALRRINTAAGRAGTRLGDLSDGTRTFRTDLDDLDGSLTRVGGRLDGLRGRVGGSSSSGGSGGGADFGLKGLLTFAPAAIPLAAGLVHAMDPLASELAAGGIAGAAFGLAVAGQIGPLGDAADAEKKYTDAVAQHGARSKEAIQAQIAYQQQLASLPPATQAAAIAISTLKKNFSDWSNDLSSFTMIPVTKGITLLDTLIPHLTPEVKSASKEFDRLVTTVGGGMASPGFDAFSAKVAAFTDSKLDQLTDEVIHLMRVISSGGADHGVIAAFVDYAKANGPAAKEALKAIAQAVITLMQGAAQAGPSLLTVVTAAARLVAALPPELVGIIIHVAAALKLLQLSGAGMAAIAGGIVRVRTAITGLTTASAAAGGGLAGLRAAFASLGVAARASIIIAGIAAVVLVLKGLSDMGKKAPPNVDKLTTSLGELGRTGKTAGEAARSFGKDFGGLADSLRTLSRPSNLDKTQQFLTKLVGMDSTPVADAKKDLDAVDKSLANLVQGGKADIAKSAFDQIAAAMQKQGMSAGELKGKLDDYKSALADQKFEQALAAQSMGLFGKAALDTQAKLDAQKKSADGLRQSIQALNDVNRAAGGAMNAFEQSIDDASKAAKENAGALKMNHGELNLSSQTARDAESALRDLAANTDDAAAKAREQGKSWQYVQGVMERGQKAFVDTAQKMGLTKTQAEALAQSYLDIPDSKTTILEMRTEDAIAGLNTVADAIKATPDKKSVTVDALTTDAITMLEGLGFKVTHLKNGQFKVTADTSTVGGSLQAVETARDGLKNKTFTVDAATNTAITSLQAVQNKIKSTNGKTVTMKAPTAAARAQLEALGFKIHQVPGSKNVKITIPTGSPKSAVSAIQSAINSLHGKTVTNYVNSIVTTTKKSVHEVVGNANGGVWDYLADGGVRAPRIHKFAAGSENHVAQIAPAGAYRVWAEDETQGEGYVPFARSKRPRSRKITEEIVRRLGGDPTAIQWNANGNVTDWRYDPQTGSLYSPSDAGQAGHKTKTVKGKSVDYFSVAAVEAKIKSAAKATLAWDSDLEKVADRVGGDVADALAAMGEDGKALAHKMATGSTKYINDMAASLRNLQKVAKASLTDYTRQLGKSNTLTKTFSDNLAKLAAEGFGDLASQLAAQNDEAAQQLAAAAVKDKGKASSANAAAKTANNALTADQVSELVAIIAAISTSKTGIHDVSAKTSLGEDEIIAVASKAKAQIANSLGSRATKFLADLGRANQHLSYADGGIRAGIYSTRAGAVRFAEPETHGEGYIPLSPSKRRTALPVLADVAHRFGIGLTDASAGRPVVVVRHGDTITVPVTPVRTGATASDIGSQVGRSVRRARRGGVNARAAGTF